MTTDHTFALDFSVRDYECDLQGIGQQRRVSELSRARSPPISALVRIRLCPTAQRRTRSVITRCEQITSIPCAAGRIHRLSARRTPGTRPLCFRTGDTPRRHAPSFCKGAFVGTCLNSNGRPGFPLNSMRSLAHKPQGDRNMKRLLLPLSLLFIALSTACSAWLTQSEKRREPGGKHLPVPATARSVIPKKDRRSP